MYCSQSDCYSFLPCAVHEETTERKSVIVCGGGVIGACTAFFLGKEGVDVTLLEGESVACSSSGKAGGYLSRSPSMIVPVCSSLVHRSFQLHLELSQLLKGETVYDFRRVTTFGAVIGEAAKHDEHRPTWMSQCVTLSSIEQADISQEGVKLMEWCKAVGVSFATREAAIQDCVLSAQIDPKKFVEAIVAYSVSNFGLKVVTGERGRVTRLAFDQAMVTGVEVGSGELYQSDKVVLAMGPWNAHIIRTIDQLPVSFREEFPLTGILAHSVLLRSPVEIPEAYGLFLDSERSLGQEHADPDVYLRPRNEVYSSGAVCVGHEVPPRQANIRPNPGSTLQLLSMLGRLSPSLHNAEILAANACFTPFIGPNETHPTIGILPRVNGVYLAGGHGVWGICQGPGTGEALARLILEQPLPFSLDEFSPSLLTE